MASPVCEPALFLPHSDGQDSLHDERIYELLGDWKKDIRHQYGFYAIPLAED